MQVKASQATTMIAKAIKAKLVPMIHGSPGIGKSSIVHAVAAQYGLKVIDIRLAQCDPTDLMGFPTIIGDRAGYRPMETFPLAGDKIPNGYNGWLLFLDEMNSAPPAIQAAAYKIVLDRMIGQEALHDHCAIVGAGNLETDNAIVEPMSTAMQSRLLHIELVSEVDEWLNWAYANAIDHRITSYIKFKPGNLYAFSPDHTDKTYACNRTWEFANRILKVTEEGDADRLPLLAGTISEGVAREFIGFCRIDSQLPKIAQIIDAPDSIQVPQEPSILFALTGAIAHHANMENMAPLAKYVNRLPVEFQVVCLKEIVRRNKNMMAHPAIMQWISTSATALF